MKWLYLLLVLLVAAFISGCVDKNQGETQIPDQKSVPSGDGKAVEQPITVSKTPAASLTPSSLQTPPNSEDIFGTESDLAAMNSTFEDMNTELTLLDSI